MERPPNSPLDRIPSQFNIDVLPRIPISDTNSTPPKLKPYYSNKIFRTVCFMILCFMTLGISTSLVFTDRMNIENFMNIVSSLLFICTPSPLDNLIKKKKK